MTGLLKNQLGFKGIVVTDALDMAGLTRLYSANIGRAAVDAFKAGNDLLLIPADLDGILPRCSGSGSQRRNFRRHNSMRPSSNFSKQRRLSGYKRARLVDLTLSYYFNRKARERSSRPANLR